MGCSSSVPETFENSCEIQAYPTVEKTSQFSIKNYEKKVSESSDSTTDTFVETGENYLQEEMEELEEEEVQRGNYECSEDVYYSEEKVAEDSTDIPTESEEARDRTESAISEKSGVFQGRLSLMRKFYEWEEIPMDFFVDKFVEDDESKAGKNKLRERLSTAKAARQHGRPSLDAKGERRGSSKRGSSKRGSTQRKSARHRASTRRSARRS